MDFLKMRDERIMNRLAVRIARYMADYDHYGFMDSLEAGETFDDGLKRAVDEVYSELSEGNYDTVIGWVFDPDADERMMAEQSAIIRQIRRLEECRRRRNRKNVSGYKGASS